MRQTLPSDKRAARNGESNETFGKRYYQRLRDTYCSNGSPGTLLARGEDNLPVNSDLFNAMAALKRTPVNRCSDHGHIYIYTGYT